MHKKMENEGMSGHRRRYDSSTWMFSSRPKYFAFLQHVHMWLTAAYGKTVVVAVSEATVYMILYGGYLFHYGYMLYSASLEIKLLETSRSAKGTSIGDQKGIWYS